MGEEQEKMDLMLNPLSDIAIDLAQPKLDERVIDIGCGCGATSIEKLAEVRGLGDGCIGLDVVQSERASIVLQDLFTEADASSFEFSSDQHLLFRFKSCFLPIRLKLL